MNEPQLENRTYDEIQIGESARLQRRLTEKDIKLFAAVSGDVNPTHLDASYSPSQGGVVGHSMWGASLVSGLLGNVLPGPGTVYRRQDFRFHCLVRLDDVVTVTITAQAKCPEHKTVTFECSALNQRHEVVLDGTAEVFAPLEKTTTARPELPGVIIDDNDAYDGLLRRVGKLDLVTAAVAHPCERTALLGALQAAEANLIRPILIGPADKIRHVAAQAEVSLEGVQIVEVAHSHQAAVRAVELIRAGEAEILMKGSLHTAELLSAVLSSSTGLRTERRISHAFVMSVPTYPKPLVVTDAAININPDLDDKRDICQNAIDLCHVVGMEGPRVALLAAVETVSAKMPSTLDAAALCKMADRGQITGGVLDGPLALDNAISVQAARTKGITSKVAGEADVLVAPDLEAANILAKQLTFLANADAAGIVLGARVPIILTSRADSVRTRTASCAIAVLQAHARRSGRHKAASHG